MQAFQFCAAELQIYAAGAAGSPDGFCFNGSVNIFFCDTTPLPYS